MLPLLLTAILANAQVEVTSYRGAFAPSPVRMWTENWTNWNPQATVYPASNVSVTGVLTGNVTWTSNNVYLLQGVVYVDSLATLTIQPGTIIKGDDATANSSLIVQRGGKLIAEGTPCNPIVFTTEAAAGSRAPGQWGGIILLGKAKHNLGTNILIEGLSAASSRNYHGGTDDNDNSGSLKYVRIEYGGYVFAANNEINGLTMGSVGRGTTIDYVQTSFINDDAFEWFGGTVNCKHLVAYRCLDDDFDTDNGFSGTVQFCLGVKDPAISDNPTISTSEGFESDNEAGGTNEGLAPKTSASFYNVTQIGAFRCASNTAGSGVTPTAIGFFRGARLRRNTDIKIFNSILMNNRVGVRFDGTLAQGNVDQDSLVFRNNIIAGDFSTSWTAPYAVAPGKSIIAEDAATRTRLIKVEYGNDSLNTCSLLANAWDFLSPDYRPNTAGAGALVVSNVTASPDLNTFAGIDNSLFAANAAFDLVVNVGESGNGASVGVITLTIAKAPGWLTTVPGITLSATNQSGVNGNSDVDGGTPNNNGDWNFRETATSIIATSKQGVIIPKSGIASLGFRAVRRAGTTTGTNQSLGFVVAGGGDNTSANNSSLIPLGTQ